MKYKYYFYKPKSDIAKDILSGLIICGAIVFAASSPYFAVNLMKNIAYQRKYKKKKRRAIDAFRRLKKQGCIAIRRKNNQIYINLTDRGKKMAGWLQIDALKIKSPPKWDRKWRLVTFDIAQLKKIYREAFRGKLKELGFLPLQKSVWIHPFECRDEVGLLREFFGLTEKEMRFIVTEAIGDDSEYRKIFKI